MEVAHFDGNDFVS
jgi:hypothetical protein